MDTVKAILAVVIILVMVVGALLITGQLNPDNVNPMLKSVDVVTEFQISGKLCQGATLSVAGGEPGTLSINPDYQGINDQNCPGGSYNPAFKKMHAVIVVDGSKVYPLPDKSMCCPGLDAETHVSWLQTIRVSSGDHTVKVIVDSQSVTKDSAGWANKEIMISAG